MSSTNTVIFTGRLYRFLGRNQQQPVPPVQTAGAAGGAPTSPTFRPTGRSLAVITSRSRSVSPQPPMAVAAEAPAAAKHYFLNVGDTYSDANASDGGGSSGSLPSNQPRRSADATPSGATGMASMSGFRPFRTKQPSPAAAAAADESTSSAAWRALQCYIRADGVFIQCERDDDGMETEVERLTLTDLLRSSVRLVDESLLAKRHCFSTCDAAGHLAYFAAPTRQQRLIWVTLMKQATGKVDSRGTRYRVDRDVRVRVMEARGLRIPSGMVMANATSGAGAASTDHAKKDANNGSGSAGGGWLATLEIGGERAARTVVVPGAVTLASTHLNTASSASSSSVTAEVFWMEEFNISDLGSTGGELSITVWSRVISGGRRKEVRVGTAIIHLVPIKPGEVVEDWFPIIDDKAAKDAPAKHAIQNTQGLVRRASTNKRDERPGGVASREGVVGEIRLRIRYDRLSVLPTKEYGNLRKAMSEVSSELMYDVLVGSDSIDRLTENIVRIYTAQGMAEAWLKSMVEREVRTASDTHTLFRGNTVMTKAVDAYMKLVGWQYLDDTVGGVVRWICDSRVHCELDPARMEGKVDLQHQSEELAAYATILWKKVESTKSTFPEELRRLFAHVQYAVVSRFDPATYPNARYTCVSGFLFLRLFCPAILSPRQFELVREHPPQKTLRTLTLLAKLIQSLGNLAEFGAKEPYMASMNPFIRDHSSGLMDFIDQVVISRKTANVASPIPAPASLGAHLIPEQTRLNPLAPPTMPNRPKDELYAPPASPYLIDLDRELSQFSGYIASQKDKLLSGAQGMRPNVIPRESQGDSVERLVAECDALQSKVTGLRKEGKEPSREKLA